MPDLHLTDIVSLARGGPDAAAWDAGVACLHGAVPVVTLDCFEVLRSAEVRALLDVYERCRRKLLPDGDSGAAAGDSGAAAVSCAAAEDSGVREVSAQFDKGEAMPRPVSRAPSRQLEELSARAVAKRLGSRSPSRRGEEMTVRAAAKRSVSGGEETSARAAHRGERRPSRAAATAAHRDERRPSRAAADRDERRSCKQAVVITLVRDGTEGVDLLRLSPIQKEEIVYPGDDLAFWLLGVRGCAALVARTEIFIAAVAIFWLTVTFITETFTCAPPQKEGGTYEGTCQKPLWGEALLCASSSLLLACVIALYGSMQRQIVKRVLLQAGTMYIWATSVVFVLFGMTPSYAYSPVRGSIWFYAPYLFTLAIGFPVIAMSDALPAKVRRPIVLYVAPLAVVYSIYLSVALRMPGAQASTENVFLYNAGAETMTSFDLRLECLGILGCLLARGALNAWVWPGRMAYMHAKINAEELVAQRGGANAAIIKRQQTSPSGRWGRNVAMQRHGSTIMPLPSR